MITSRLSKCFKNTFNCLWNPSTHFICIHMYYFPRFPDSTYIHILQSCISIVGLAYFFWIRVTLVRRVLLTVFSSPYTIHSTSDWYKRREPRWIPNGASCRNLAHFAQAVGSSSSSTSLRMPSGEYFSIPTALHAMPGKQAKSRGFQIGGKIMPLAVRYTIKTE